MIQSKRTVADDFAYEVVGNLIQAQNERRCNDACRHLVRHQHESLCTLVSHGSSYQMTAAYVFVNDAAALALAGLANQSPSRHGRVWNGQLRQLLPDINQCSSNAYHLKLRVQLCRCWAIKQCPLHGQRLRVARRG
jgi:hypothetical protein